MAEIKDVILKMEANTPKPNRRKTPIFAGFTEKGEKIVLYVRGNEFFLKISDGKIWVLSSASSWELSWDIDKFYYLKVVSSMWSGTAKGTRIDTIKEDSVA